MALAKKTAFRRYVLSECVDSEEELGAIDFATYDEAKAAMKEAWGESLPAGGLCGEWEEMSGLGAWAAIMYRNGVDVLAWSIYEVRDVQGERIAAASMKRLVTDSPEVTRYDLADLMCEEGVGREEALAFADDVFEAALREEVGRMASEQNAESDAEPEAGPEASCMEKEGGLGV